LRIGERAFTDYVGWGWQTDLKHKMKKEKMGGPRPFKAENKKIAHRRFGGRNEGGKSDAAQAVGKARTRYEKKAKIVNGLRR